MSSEILYVLGGSVVVLGCLLGVSMVKNQMMRVSIQNKTPEDYQKILKLKEKYIEDLEDEIDNYAKERDELVQEVRSWRGKFNQKGQIPKIKGENYDLTKKSDIGIVAEDVLNQVQDHLPDDLQKIIKDPGIKKKILDYANEHPEEAAGYLKYFLSQPSQKVQSSIIPGFDESKAV